MELEKKLYKFMIEMKLVIGKFKIRLKHAYMSGVKFKDKTLTDTWRNGLNVWERRVHKYLVGIPSQMNKYVEDRYICRDFDPFEDGSRFYFGYLDWSSGK